MLLVHLKSWRSLAGVLGVCCALSHPPWAQGSAFQHVALQTSEVLIGRRKGCLETRAQPAAQVGFHGCRMNVCLLSYDIAFFSSTY